jgi:signal transduction histidine kinase
MSRAATGAVLLAYAIVLTLAVAGTLVTDPGSDVGCWRDCRSNPFLVADVPQLAIALRDALSVAMLGCGIAIASIALARLDRASTPARSRLTPLLVASVAMGGAVSAAALRVLADPILRPREPFDAALFLVLAGAVATFAAALAWTVLRGRELIAAVGELGADAGDPAAGSQVQQRLVIAAGDPGLVVAYHFSEPERWVDAVGIEIPAPSPGAGYAVTPLVRGGEVIAAVTHDPSVLAPVDLEAALGPATRLAMENERLRAGILAELSALRASRGQIVATGDRERLRLERDLHDGAQQRLLALSCDLRMARAAAVSDGLELEVQQLDGLIASARSAHEELRELAHGIFPAILSEAGLGPALETFARRADIPVDLVVEPARTDQEAETAAYAAVTSAIKDATAMGATAARVVIGQVIGGLRLLVTDDGSLERGTPDDLADRVGAAGGTIVVGQTAGWRQLEATIPCA